MAHILTEKEAANALRCELDDDNMLDLLPLVDGYIENATGRDWAGDSTVHPAAKAAARMLIVRWHEDPGSLAAGGALILGLSAAMAQLEAIALHYYEFEGLSGAGYLQLAAAREGDKVTSVTGLTTGKTGDQSALFESVISESGYLKQLSSLDLEDYYFRVLLTPLSEQ